VDHHTIDVNESDGTVRVRLGGEIDVSCVRTVRAAIGAFVGLDDVRVIVVDLADVTFLDSSGLGALLAASQRAKGARQHFEITNPSTAVQRVLEVTGTRHLVAG